MARYEGTTDIPEHAHLANDKRLNWDVRARGLGGTLRSPLTTCAEENILCYQIDKYHAEDILVHEFAHSIHLIGIISIDPGFNDRLQQALDAAIAEGKWNNTYAQTNISEYWAEGVQSWFNVNAEVEYPDGKHNHVNTRSDLKNTIRACTLFWLSFSPKARNKYPATSTSTFTAGRNVEPKHRKRRSWALLRHRLIVRALLVKTVLQA